MIQDIAPHRYDNAYKPEAPDKDSIALYYEDHRRTAVLSGGEIKSSGNFFFYIGKYRDFPACEAEASCICGNYRLSALSMVSESPVLRTLRKADEAGYERTDVVL